MKIDRRKLARLWDVFLIAAGAIVLYLATDTDAKAYLAEMGGPVTIGIGVLNILLNRLPKGMIDKIMDGGAEPKP